MVWTLNGNIWILLKASAVPEHQKKAQLPKTTNAIKYWRSAVMLLFWMRSWFFFYHHTGLGFKKQDNNNNDDDNEE